MAARAPAVPAIEFGTRIEAAPEEIYRVVGDPRSKVVWVPAIKRVEMRSRGEPGLGSRYLASSGIGRIEFPFDEEIVRWEPPHHLAYRGTASWGEFLATWTLEPAGTGTRVYYRMDFWFRGALGAVLSLGAGLMRPLLSRWAAARVKYAIERGLWRSPCLKDSSRVGRI